VNSIKICAQPGVELDVTRDSDTFILEDVNFLIEHAELGSIDFKQIELEFKDNTITLKNLLGVKGENNQLTFPKENLINEIKKFI